MIQKSSTRLSPHSCCKICRAATAGSAFLEVPWLEQRGENLVKFSAPDTELEKAAEQQ